ncbi:SGNH/GDSL hydrolase family protein [Streptomyces sp. SID8375]|uniref:SGNH/GDSL hydrolase family protein n=1 Tax=unclassified Streptomyces TaxID=2593676 RepID=UPI0003664128|nr:MULTISPECIES: SGNH/GDSL hydrolase family protein [unclassified Streptomyces]MYX07887.1 SGNH/GDSL hydrolase family protein [Streptomyces sp. SID8375]
MGFFQFVPARRVVPLVGMAMVMALVGAGGAAGGGGGAADAATDADAVADAYAAGPRAARWTEAWGAAVQQPVEGDVDDVPNWSGKGFRQQSVRQVVRVSAGGARVRIRLSNRFGKAPLRVDGAVIARSGGGAQAWPGTTRKVTFRHSGRHSASTVIPAGGEAIGDAVRLSTSPLENLVVTLYFAGATGPATFHRVGLTTSYRAAGNHLNDVLAKAYRQSSESSYFLSGVDVSGPFRERRNTVVALGDSATDGVGSTPEAHGGYTDGLAERLVAARRNVGVVNAGIAGNMLLTSSSCFGEKGVTRFRRDVLDRPGVRTVIVELGANDVGANWATGPCFPSSHKPVSARQIAEGYRTLIRAAHGRGIKVIGATLVPLKGYPGYSAKVERLRAQVNHWIRTSGAYDAVVDFDKALADPAHPDRPRPGYVYEDGLHPNDAGYQAIVNAFDPWGL